MCETLIQERSRESRSTGVSTDERQHDTGSIVFPLTFYAAFYPRKKKKKNIAESGSRCSKWLFKHLIKLLFKHH